MYGNLGLRTQINFPFTQAKCEKNVKLILLSFISSEFYFIKFHAYLVRWDSLSSSIFRVSGFVV
jgi:hypothetical protein